MLTRKLKRHAAISVAAAPFLTSACEGKPATAPVICPSLGLSIIRTVDDSPSAMTPQHRNFAGAPLSCTTGSAP